MAKNLPFPKGRKRCMFCGSFGVSKEHVFAKWLQKIVGSRDNASSVHAVETEVVDLETGQRKSEWRKGTLQRPGDILSQTLKCVCKNCNNGWMSQLQTNAKMPLTKIIDGSWQPLTLEEMNILSAWVTMFVMVYETAHRETAASDDTDRRFFWTTRRPPIGWSMFVGPFEGAHYNPAIYKWTRYIPSKVNPASTPTSNTQGTTIAIGKLVIHVFSSRAPEVWTKFNPVAFSEFHELGLLYPGNNQLMERPNRVWDDQGFEYLHFAIREEVMNKFERNQQ